MTKLQKDKKELYDNLDSLRERLEFRGLKEEQNLLEAATEALNRYLSVVEKFDRSDSGRK